MPKFDVHLFNRETGKEVVRTVEGTSERKVTLSAADDQHVVGRVVLKGPTDAELEADLAARRAADAASKAEAERNARAEQAKQPAIDRIEPLRRPARSMRIVSAVLCVVGAIMLIGGFGMDTTSGKVHNIGLLNQQSNVVITGCAVALAGFIALAIGEATGVVCNVLAGLHDIGAGTTRRER